MCCAMYEKTNLFFTTLKNILSKRIEVGYMKSVKNDTV